MLKAIAKGVLTAVVVGAMGFAGSARADEPTGGEPNPTGPVSKPGIQSQFVKPPAPTPFQKQKTQVVVTQKTKPQPVICPPKPLPPAPPAPPQK